MSRSATNRGVPIATLLGVALAAILSLAARAQAAWPSSPTVNVPICTLPGSQGAPLAVSDGAGGAIIVWSDVSTGQSDVYAQRVDATGATLWTSNGVALTTAPGHQNATSVASDGAGGAIAVWVSNAGAGVFDIYAQRIDASGTVVWPVNGVAVCTAPGLQLDPVLTADGSGGVIISWSDWRSGGDVYAQRLDGTGVPSWAANGVPVCSAASSQQMPSIVSDGAGGAIIGWLDFRGGSDNDVYAQRVDASGIPQWTPNGVPVCTLPGNQYLYAAQADGSGGVILSWGDNRTFIQQDLYAQKLSGSGAPQWTANGVALCTAPGSQDFTSICSDGAGGAIITWTDPRGADLDVYAQRIASSGLVAWTANGVPVCTAPGNQGSVPRIVSDEAGGAIIAWPDYRNGPASDLFAQRLGASGTRMWPANGVALCTAAGFQGGISLCGDGAGGVIATWGDGRNAGDGDVYAQRIETTGSFNGPVPWGTIAGRVTAQCPAPATPVPGVTVNAFEVGSGNLIGTDVTDANGDYSLSDIQAVPCTITLVTPPSFVAPSAVSATVPNGATLSVNFDLVCALGDIAGRVTASCPAAATPLLGVTVDAFAVGSGDLAGTGVTDANGNFSILGVPAIPYTVTLVTPLGFSTPAAEVSATVPNGGTATVDFDLACVAVSGKPNGSGFWKHQFGVATGGNGTAQFNASALCADLDLIEVHFNNNALNQVIVYDPASGTTCAQKLDLAKDLLNLSGSAAPIDKARQQLLSLLLNVAANDLSLLDVAGKDGATVSQAVTYCDQIIDNPSGDYVLAAAIADKINSGQKVTAGVIPLSTPIIAYAKGRPSLEFSAGRNPATGPRTFRFTLGASAKVDLSIYDVHGRRVAQVYSGTLPQGQHSLAWSGTGARGEKLGRGLYFSRLVAGDETRVARLVQTTP